MRTEGPLVWTVTIIGEVPKGTAVMRSGAQVGDVVGITNYVGYAATGLGALSYNLEGYDMTKIGHQRPDPQIELGEQLRQLGVHSMNDISDGLGSELNEIASASNVSILVEESAIPLHEETYALAKHLQTKPVDYALYGGEDFQLVFTAPKSLVPKLENLAGITLIGEVVTGPPKVEMVTHDRTIKTIEAKDIIIFMNHKAQVQLETHTVEDTQQFGQTLGKWVQQNGDPICISLIGDFRNG